MKRLTVLSGLLSIFFFLIIVVPVYSQSVADSTAPAKDTLQEFDIIRGPSMRSIYVDSSTTLQTIAGGAIIRQGTTLLKGDSVVINPTTHVAEAFGNVNINQNDSILTYSDYLKYVGTDKTAFLQGNVRLKDRNNTLYTQQLDYNLETGIGNYHSGGKVINKKTTITSQDGTYYADTKDIFFKNNVVLIDPKNHITSDSLLYNMNTGASNFYTHTRIKNKQVEIHTSQGNYDTNTGNALFTTRTEVRDSSNRIYIANRMALDNKTGNAQLEGNALVRDSAGGFTVLANQIFMNNKKNTFLATRKPVLIIKQKDDSIYVAADTIFSGFSSGVRQESFVIENETVAADSLHRKMLADSGQDRKMVIENSLPKFRSPVDSAYFMAHEIDSLNGKIKAPLPAEMKNQGKAFADSVHSKSPGADSTSLDSLKKKGAIAAVTTTLQPPALNPSDSTKLPPGAEDSLKAVMGKQGKMLQEPGVNDSSGARSVDTLNETDTSRYFLAYHHVRIFSDSLQSTCDSLYFSAKDSVFRLFDDPVIWSGRTQITGDTIFLFTKNKKPERLYAFDKGIIVNKTSEGFFNQISGKTINGYFINGSIDYMRVRGSQAESIYYAQDQDSAYLGMDRTTSDVINLYFKKDDLQKVVYVNQISGKFYPMSKIPDDQRYLKSFIWLDKQRPKSKIELFE